MMGARKTLFSGVFALGMSISCAANAEMQVLYFGGGAEAPGKKRTMFDYAASNVAKYAAGNKIPAEYFFDLSHKGSVDTIKSSSGQEPKEFSAAGWNQRMTQLKKELEEGRTKSSILILVDTHGKEEDGEYFISTSNGHVNPKPLLKEVIEAAGKRGVHIGVVFGSCESGAAEDLGNDKACVITASGPGQLAYANDFNSWSNKLASSANLEEMFLNARIHPHALFTVAAQPMISSPAGRETAREMRLMNQYIFATPEKALPRMQEKACVSPANTFLEKMIQLGEPPARSIKAVTSIREKMAEYERIKQERLDHDSKTWTEACHDAYMPKHKPSPQPVASDGLPAPRLITCAWSESDLQHEQAWLLDELRKLKLQGGDEAREREIRQILEQVLKSRNDPELRAKFADEKNQNLLQKQRADQMFRLGKQIAGYERELYDTIYAVKAKELAGKPNPCAAFSLK
jgi:hypothetical protein